MRGFKMKRSGMVLSILGMLLLPALSWAGDASSCLPPKGAKAEGVSSLDDPGAIQLSEMAACISSVDGNFAWLRDVALANDVEWLDRGYRGTYSGVFVEVYQDQDPLWRKGDLLFASMGMAGIFVFDVSDRRLDEFHLVGHLQVEDQSALLLQYDSQRGVVYAGGNDYGKPGRPPLIAAWDIRYVNASPKIEYKPSPAFSVNKPWKAGHLAVDPTGMGLLYTWSDSEGPIAVPIEAPEFKFSGLYLPEKEALPPLADRQPGDVLPSIQRLTSRFVPLGVPRVVKRETDEPSRSEERDELEGASTAAFKVRLALPGSFGETLTAKVESLRVLPEARHLGKQDLGAAIMPPGGPGWPDATVTVTLRRLGVGDDEQGSDPDQVGGEAGHFSEAFNLYESEETVLLLADPRARREYKLQDVTDAGNVDENDRTRKYDERANCRNCDWPQYFPDPKGASPPPPGALDGVEELLAGRYVRAVLFVDPDSPQGVQQKTREALDFFEAQGDNYPAPTGYVDIAAPADAVPSPIQVSLGEPAQNPAMWSPGETGVSVALSGGDLILDASDHVVGGRGLAFTFDRVYRSHSLGYGPLGSTGWGANLFAHLREIDTTGEVEYHDGRGHVWRFYPNAEEDAPVPDEDAYDEDFAASYHPPKGVYMRLQKLRDDRGWRLIGRSHDTAEFNNHGRLLRISDRHRRGQDPDEQGNTLHLRYDTFGQLVGVTDDLNRTYEFEYFDDPKPVADGGDGDRYGLLKKITDFADRELEYEYDGKRRLIKVHYPEVQNPVDAYSQFSYEGAQRPFLEYTYDPDAGVEPFDNTGDAILHGEFAQLRISEVYLPDFLESTGRPPRARFTYTEDTGRLATVGFPTPSNENNSVSSVVWTLQPSVPERDDAGPATSYVVRAPWGHEVEYQLTRGRTTRVEQQLAVVNKYGISTDGVTVGTDFSYRDDGRLEQVEYPDGGLRILCYGDSDGGGEGGCDGFANNETVVDHLAKANVVKALMKATDEDGRGTAEYLFIETGAQYQEDNVVASVTDGLSRGIQLAVPVANAEDTRLFETEGVQSSFEYDAFGRAMETENGISNPSKVKKTFHEDAAGKNGAGLTKRIEVGLGQIWREVEYDERYNPAILTNSQGTRSETIFDTWDRPVGTISGLSDGRYLPVGSAGCSEGKGARQETAFDPAGHVIRERRLQDYVDASGTVQCRWVETRYRYNAREQLVELLQTHLADPGQEGQVLNAPTKVSETVFDSHGRISILRTLNLLNPALETVYRYDSSGRVIGVKVGEAGEQLRGYDRKSRVVFETDGHEGDWLGRYDVWDRLYHQRYATGAHELATFDKSGNLTQRVTFDSDPLAPSGDPKLLSLQRSHFNSFGAVERVATTLIDEDDQKEILITEQEFDDAGRLRAVWSGPPKSDDPQCLDVSVSCLDTAKARREKEIVYETDTGRPLEVRFGGVYRGDHLFAHRNEYHPDNASPLVDTMRYLERVPGQEPMVETRSVGYDRDAFGRIIAERENSGSVTFTTYDRAYNQPILVRNGAGADIRFGADGAGKIIQVFRPNDRGRTLYLYDLDGRLLRQITTTEENPWVTQFTYDQTGRARRIEYHDNTFEEFTYHPDSTIDTFRTRDEITITHTYDAANRLRASVPSAGNLSDSLVALDVGDFTDWDVLSRPTSLRRGSPGLPGEDGGLTVSYPTYDLGSRPGQEIIGTRSPLVWTFDIYSRVQTVALPLGLSRDNDSSFQGFTRQFDTLDRLEDVSGLGELTQATVGATWYWGGGGRPYGSTTKTTLGTASRYGYIDGAGPQTLGDHPPSSTWNLGTMTWGAGDNGPTTAPSKTWGQFAFGWRGIDGDSRDGAKIGRQVKTGSNAGGIDLFAGMGWAWNYDVGVRLTEAYPGRGDLQGRNVDQSEGLVYEYGEGDEIERIIDQSAGEITDVETGPYGRILKRGGVDFFYDAVGRRTEDDRYTYRWNWRSELMEVVVKGDWPNEEVSPYAGHKIKYAYDASGRMVQRLHWGASADGNARPFIERRDYVWELDRLASEVGFGDPEGITKRWRKTYVPGISGLDDGPQVMVENLAFPGGPFSKSLYTYLRDELGTVIGLVAEEESQDPNRPTIPARYLYTVYGEAHLEVGPELRRARFRADLDSVTGVGQSVGPGKKAGGLELFFSGALDATSVSGSVFLERLDSGGWQAVPSADFVAGVGADPMSLQVLLVGGWDLGVAYRARLSTDLRDVAGRNLGEEQVLDWSVPSQAQLTVAYDRRFSPSFDNVASSSDTLGGRFPGGQSHLFQGLWTDPATGLSYARARWYDARNVSWLSEDPLSDIDSPNLYAFVSWQPNMSVDPQGLQGMPNFNIWDSGKEMVEESGPAVVEEGGAMLVEEVGPIGILNGLSSSILGYDFVRDEVVEGFWPRALSLLGAVPGIPNNLRKADNVGGVAKHADNLPGGGRGPKNQVGTGDLGHNKSSLDDFASARQADLTPNLGDEMGTKCVWSCFTAGTLVSTESGLRPIEEISVGDKVWARNPATGDLELAEVAQTFQREAGATYLIYAGSDVLEATGEHPFWVDGRGWTEVADLVIGDFLVTDQSKLLRIELIQFLDSQVTVYNFEVEGLHSYFVGDQRILVHNCRTVLVRHRAGNKQIMAEGNRWNLPKGRQMSAIPTSDPIGDEIQRLAKRYSDQFSDAKLTQTERFRIQSEFASESPRYWLINLWKKQAKGRYVDSRVKGALAKSHPHLRGNAVGVDIVDPQTGLSYDLLSGSKSNIQTHALRMPDVLFRYIEF